MSSFKLKVDNRPTVDGEYMGGNHNDWSNRLEVEFVKVKDGLVYVEGDEKPFLLSDFDFWSDLLEGETK